MRFSAVILIVFAQVMGLPAQSAIDVYTTHLTIWSVDELLDSLEVVELSRGDEPPAIEMAEDPNSDGQDLLMVAIGQIQRGDHLRALHFIQRSLLEFEKSGFQKGQGDALFLIGWIKDFRGEYQEASNHFEQSSEIYKAGEHRAELGYTLKKLGDSYTKMDAHPIALQHYLQGLEVAKDTESIEHIAKLNLDIGKAYHKLGENDKALQHLHRARRLNNVLQDSSSMVKAHNYIGEVHLDQLTYDSALVYLETAFELAQQANHLSQIKSAAQMLYLLYENQQHHEKALDYHKVFRTVNDSLAKLQEQSKLVRLKNDHSFKLELLRYQQLLKREQTFLVLTLSGLAICIILIFILMRYYHQKKAGMVNLQRKNDEILKTKNQLVVQEKLASLGQLAAGIAHEIKNPLNFVINFAESSAYLSNELFQTLERQKSQLKGEEFIAISEIIEDLKQNSIDIKRNGQRADRIVRSIMEHARGRSGKLQVVDIHTVIDENINLAYHGYRALDPSFNLYIEKLYYSSPIIIEAVPQDISRVLINLINNACYALNRKRRSVQLNFRPTLVIRTALIGDSCEIRLHDNGPGIRKDILSEIFNPFFTTKPTGEGNTGLGLSISHDIVVGGHNGTMKAESEYGTFTQFIISLPLRQSIEN